MTYASAVRLARIEVKKDSNRSIRRGKQTRRTSGQCTHSYPTSQQSPPTSGVGSAASLSPPPPPHNSLSHSLLQRRMTYADICGCANTCKTNYEPSLRPSFYLAQLVILHRVAFSEEHQFTPLKPLFLYNFEAAIFVQLYLTTIMHLRMPFHVALLREFLPTDLAGERFLLSVNSQMSTPIPLFWKRFPAVFALVS